MNDVLELVGRKKKNSSGLFAIGILLVSAGIILTIVLFGGELNLQQLAWVRAGPDGVTVGGLSEENAMWFGGFLAVLYIVGTGMMVKGRSK